MSWIIDYVAWVGLAVGLLVTVVRARNWIRARPGWAAWIGALFVLPFFLHELIDDHPVWSFCVWVGALVPVLTRFGGGGKQGLAYRINSRLRKTDFWLNRTHGGWLQTQLRLPGYSPVIFVFSFYALLILMGGPTRSVPTGIATGVAWFALLALSYPFARREALHHFIAVAVLATAWVVYDAAGARSREADGTIYRHVFLFVLPCVVGVAYIGRGLAHWLLGYFKNQYQNAWADAPQLLEEAELHVIPTEPDFAAWRVIRSGLATPFSNPLMFLFPVAVVVLLAPYEYLGLAAWWAAWLVWALLALAGIHERLKNMLLWVAQPFLRGVVFVASATVIALAGCRLADFSYVAILLNSTTVWTILWMLAAVYVTLWFYDYWIGYVLCEHLLALLNPGSTKDRCSQVPYQIDSSKIPVADRTAIRDTDRVIQIHGTRFVVIGQYQDHETHEWKDGWELYDRIDLFDTLIKRARGASPAVAKQFGLADLRQRIGVYYVVLNLLLVAVIGLFGWLGRRTESVPELSATADLPGTFSLQQSLLGEQGGRPRRRAIVVAASGGGTRAALFSESLFQGLAELDALPDVVLYSGVSGGSAAIADTLLHYDGSLPNAGAYNWPTHSAALSSPFIDDVIRGLWEIRMHHGTRSGTLLSESMQRRLSCAALDELKLQLGSVTKVGVIFNSTLAGSDRWNSATNGWADADPSVAGGRLVVTNLQGDLIFPEQGYKEIESEYLPYIVVRDPRAVLTTAAALSANFPPAFSNAAVVLEANHVPQHRYWVTDGGASDNRGAISALYAVLHALKQEPPVKKSRPALHLVIADASALNLDFAQDRGISSAIGAAEKYANELMTEILKEIANAYENLGGKQEDLHVYYLPMPALLRAHGGVQTHWMLPAYITVVNPADAADKMRLRGTEVRQLIMDLHHPDYTRRDDPNASIQQKQRLEAAWKWIKADRRPERIPPHHETWQRLVEALR